MIFLKKLNQFYPTVIVHFTDKLSPAETEIPVTVARFCSANILAPPSVRHSPVAVITLPSGPLNTPDCVMLFDEFEAPKSNGVLPAAAVSKTTTVPVPPVAAVNVGVTCFLAISPVVPESAHPEDRKSVV